MKVEKQQNPRVCGLCGGWDLGCERGLGFSEETRGNAQSPKREKPSSGAREKCYIHKMMMMMMMVMT
jgi:hypothetical protein